MISHIDLRVSQLLAARICHDLVGPVAAINNGVELLGDDDPDFARDAVALVGDSARKAANRLQFFRFAYGASQTALAGPPPQQLAQALFEGTAILCEYGDAPKADGIDWHRLACSLLLVGSEALPRGGRLTITPGMVAPNLQGVGEGNGLSAEICAALTRTAPVADLTARTVGAYYAALLAEAQGCRLVTRNQPGGFSIATEPSA